MPPFEDNSPAFPRVGDRICLWAAGRMRLAPDLATASEERRKECGNSKTEYACFVCCHKPAANGTPVAGLFVLTQSTLDLMADDYLLDYATDVLNMS